MRWRLILGNLPDSGAPNMRKRCEQEIADWGKRVAGYRSVLWAALNYDPDAEDAPEPVAHWDKTAMEDDSD
jgi:hypothetical protein